VIQAVESVNGLGIDLKLTSAVVEIRFLGRKPIGVFTGRNGASLVDRFLSGYVLSHSLIDPSQRPTFGRCNEILESVEGRAKEFILGSPSIVKRDYDLIIVPESSLIFGQYFSSLELNKLSQIYLRETLLGRLGYSLDLSFTNLRQAEKTNSPRLIKLPRQDEHGIIRNA